RSGESGNAIALAALCEEAGDCQPLLQALRENDWPNIFRLAVPEPAYRGGGEQCGTPEAVNWVVYASHESSITIAEDRLTEIFAKKWPEWSRAYLPGLAERDG